MKNFQKGFVVPLLIVIIALSIGGGVYLAAKNRVRVPSVIQNSEKVSLPLVVQDEISKPGWKIHKDTQNNYEFQYPSSFEFKGLRDSPEKKSYFQDSSTSTEDYKGIGKNAIPKTFFLRNIKDPELKNYRSYRHCEYVDDGKYFLEPLTINSLSGCILSTGEAGGSNKLFFIFPDNDDFMVEMSSAEDEIQPRAPIEKIVSTLKFIK